MREEKGKLKIIFGNYNTSFSLMNQIVKTKGQQRNRIIEQYYKPSRHNTHLYNTSTTNSRIQILSSSHGIFSNIVKMINHKKALIKGSKSVIKSMFSDYNGI